MITTIGKFLPAVLLGAGAIVTTVSGTPRPTPLVRPLTATMPTSFMGHPAREIPISDDEVKASGVTDFINRAYDMGDSIPVMLYVGYHATQQGDNRMHSPSQCLPGSGWTPVGSSIATVPLADGRKVEVNRFVLAQGNYRILTYYWFQGRGRVTAGQARLKLDAFKDSFLHHRDEEALVRVIVPIPSGGFDAPVAATGLTADSLAARMASVAIPALERSLPAGP